MKLTKFKKEKKCAYTIIGTVFGFGYDCRTGSIDDFEGHKGGIWNKVSYWVDWIRKTMAENNDTPCTP